MKSITEKKFMENAELVLGQTASMQDSYMIETEKGKVALISEKEWNSYMKIIEACMESMKISFSQRNELF